MLPEDNQCAPRLTTCPGPHGIGCLCALCNDAVWQKRRVGSGRDANSILVLQLLRPSRPWTASIGISDVRAA